MIPTTRKDHDKLVDEWKMKEIKIDIKELKEMLCTKKDLLELAVTDNSGSCLSWLNNPYCWFEGIISSRRRVYRKMAKQMNFLRELDGKNPIIKKDLFPKKEDK